MECLFPKHMILFTVTPKHFIMMKKGWTAEEEQGCEECKSETEEESWWPGLAGRMILIKQRKQCRAF